MTFVMIQIYKKGYKDNPSNYYSIVIISHARKAIEAAIAAQIK